MKLIILITVLLVLGFVGCKKDNTDYANSAICTGLIPTYTVDVATILNSYCATSSCHNSSSAKAGVNLDNYISASNEFRNNSRNLISVHHGRGVNAMPKGSSKLSETTLNKLDCWVKNSCPQ